MQPAPEARPERILELFERVVPVYDRLNHLFSMGIDRSWRRSLVEQARLRGGADVLDACTGTGDVAIALARRWPAARLTGLDASPGMLARARKKLRRAGLASRVELLQGDVLALPFADRRFDCATIAFGLRNLGDRQQGLAELARVLRRGGRLLVLEFLPPGPTPGRPPVPPVSRQADAVGRRAALRRRRRPTATCIASIASFPPPGRVLELLRAAGLRSLEFRPLSGGIAGLFQGVKE